MADMIADYDIVSNQHGPEMFSVLMHNSPGCSKPHFGIGGQVKATYSIDKYGATEAKSNLLGRFIDAYGNDVGYVDKRTNEWEIEAKTPDGGSTYFTPESVIHFVYPASSSKEIKWETTK